jgi:hypothetical protein
MNKKITLSLLSSLLFFAGCSSAADTASSSDSSSTDASAQTQTDAKTSSDTTTNSDTDTKKEDTAKEEKTDDPSKKTDEKSTAASNEKKDTESSSDTKKDTTTETKKDTASSDKKKDTSKDKTTSSSSSDKDKTSTSSTSNTMKTSTDPVLDDDLDTFITSIKDNKVLYTYGVKAYASDTDQGTYVIPGQIQTATLKDKEPTECTDMVVQGVTPAGDYLFISAYDKNEECNSVLYMMDLSSHAYIKTIVLPDKDHVGGVTYDDQTQTLWVATRTDKVSSASAISLSALEEYDFNKTSKAIKFENSVDASQLAEDSFLTYNDGKLYLGTFVKSGNSIVEVFDVTSADSFSATPEKTDTISADAQGIALYNGYTLLCDSYGHETSYLRIFQSSDETLTDSQEIASFELPERLEQISVKGDKAYVIFESAANAYSSADITKIDRVITIDLKKLFASIE